MSSGQSNERAQHEYGRGLASYDDRSRINLDAQSVGGQDGCVGMSEDGELVARELESAPIEELKKLSSPTLELLGFIRSLHPLSLAHKPAIACIRRLAWIATVWKEPSHLELILLWPLLAFDQQGREKEFASLGALQTRVLSALDWTVEPVRTNGVPLPATAVSELVDDLLELGKQPLFDAFGHNPNRWAASRLREEFALRFPGGYHRYPPPTSHIRDYHHLARQSRGALR